jgi:hypothetical protein
LVKPKSGVNTGEVTECTTKAEVEALTEAKVYRLLEAGMTSIFVMPVSDLNVSDAITASGKKFFTILVDGAFSYDDLNSFDAGSFNGVVAWSGSSREQVAKWAIAENNVGFYDLDENESQNMYHAFGKLLSANSWKNEQFIEMPYSSGIDTINMAELMFSDNISFVLTSEEYSNRLALFASNRRAIIAPYVYEELTLKLQSKALQYISLNQPNYNEAEASLLEDSLQGVVDGYITDRIITNGTVTVELTDEQFVAKATIQVAEPKALWRIRATMQQGEI